MRGFACYFCKCNVTYYVIDSWSCQAE